MSAAGLRIRALFALKALIVVTLLAAAGVMVRSALAYRQAETRHRVDLDRWAVVERPRWSVLGDVVAVRAARGVAGGSVGLFDRSAAATLRDALDAAPRVRRVVSLQRLPPDRIEAVVEMRRPAACVHLADDRYVEIDAEGVVLGEPQDARPVREGVALRVISGGRSGAPAPGGEVAADVRSGLDLCRLLDGYRDGLGATVLRTFDEVDVSNARGRVDARDSEILLRAAPPRPGLPPRTRCVVEWGRTNAEFGEPPFDEKAARLAEALRIFDDFPGIARVRVAYSELSVRAAGSPEGAWLPAMAEQTPAR